MGNLCSVVVSVRPYLLFSQSKKLSAKRHTHHSQAALCKFSQYIKVWKKTNFKKWKMCGKVKFLLWNVSKAVRSSQPGCLTAAA